MKKQRIILFLLLLAALWGVPRSAGAQIFAVRADALAALTGTLHLGGEVSVADKWSVEASGYWNPIKTSDISMNFHAVQIGSRYWLYESFVGHFVGGQLSYVGYDLGSRTRRYDGRAYGIGFSYGYAWMLSKRWFVILEAGIGLVPAPATRAAILRSETGTTSISTITDAGPLRRRGWRCRSLISFSHESA